MAYPENTTDCIMHLFPNAIPQKDFSVSKISDGSIEITDWNSQLGSEPTEDQLNAVSNDAEVTAKFRYLRKKRNRLLAETDWEMVKGLEKNEDLTDLKSYRQKLRDLPASNSDPDQIVFPTR